MQYILTEEEYKNKGISPIIVRKLMINFIEAFKSDMTMKDGIITITRKASQAHLDKFYADVDALIPKV